jgi:hypothetical protein
MPVMIDAQIQHHVGDARDTGRSDKATESSFLTLVEQGLVGRMP